MGDWSTEPRPWYDVKVVNCTLCGKMLPGKMWSATINGDEKVFCNPGCEDTYHRYWRPRYVGGAPTAGLEDQNG